MVRKLDQGAQATQLRVALQHYQSGNLKAAKAAFTGMLKRDPDSAEALHLLGCLLDEMGSTSEAIKMLMRAVNVDPNAPGYQFSLANMLLKQRNQQRAIHHYREAIRLKPDYAAAHNNLGHVLSMTGQRSDAKACFENAIRHKAGYADPHHNLGMALKAEADFTGAVAAFQEAIRIKPGFADAHCNLGSAYLQMQRIADALDEFKLAAQLQPANAKFQTNVGAAALRMGRQQDATAYFERALQLNPADANTRSNLILATSYLTPDASTLHALSIGWDHAHATGLHSVSTKLRNVPDSDRRLRIGYVSADFRNHAAAYWIEPLLAGLQHTDFAVFCYSNSPISDEVTERIRPYADTWVECAALTDDALAERIRHDEIDVLVDLSSHTEGNRLLVFARQPAPVQVSWFGLPVSTGLRTIQYRFSDAVMDPPGLGDSFYSEKLVRLDRFYAAFQPNPLALPVGTGPATLGQGVTFASINTLAKITRPMLELWATILAEVPDARLLLQAAGLDGPELAANVLQVFAEMGIPPERLLLRGWTDMQAFLGVGAEVDIVLDPFPFNGGVTTCHALWLGLPVVTLAGQTGASRVGASILSRIGLQDLVANDMDAYRAAAVGLARDTERLANLRASLRERMICGGMLDGSDLAQQAETAFRAMWRSWCAS